MDAPTVAGSATSEPGRIEMTVREIIRRDVAALHPDDTVDAARRRMRDAGIDTLPVTETSGALVGLLSENHLLSRAMPRRRPWWDAAVAGTGAPAAEYLRDITNTVAELMIRIPPAIAPDVSMEGAAALMRCHALSVVPVVEHDVLLGVITRPDVLAKLSAAPRPAPSPARVAVEARSGIRAIGR
jgi:acetoin utilization protein AcuB